MAWFFGHKRPKEKLAVVFDIGNASVGAALVGISKDSIPKIFYTTRHEINMSKEPTSKDLLLKMTRALKEAGDMTLREGLPHVRFTLFNTLKPTIVLYTLSSPWCVSQVRTIKKKSERAFVVERDLVKTLILKELNEFRKAHASSEEDHERNQYEIIEGDILDIRLSRYVTVDPIGKKTDELEMTLFASSAQKTLTDALESTARNLFSGARVQFSSFTLPFFNTVRDVWHGKQNYILLDISGELSEISIVKNGVLHDTVSFPFGQNTLIRHVARELNLSPQEAVSIVNMHARGHLGDFEARALKKALDSSKSQWLGTFLNELKGISARVLLPHDVFLTTDAVLQGWFKKSIEGHEFSSMISADRPFQVILVDEKTLGAHCEASAGVDKDPFLIVETLFLNKKMSPIT